MSIFIIRGPEAAGALIRTAMPLPAPVMIAVFAVMSGVSLVVMRFYFVLLCPGIAQGHRAVEYRRARPAVVAVGNEISVAFKLVT